MPNNVMMRSLFALILLLIVCFTNKAQERQISEVTFLTEDQISISASYELPETESLLPAIILIHQGGSSRQEWVELELWNQLVAKGYAILAYDIRIHGKSGKDRGDIYDLFNNPKRSPLDLIAAINFLEQDKRIDKKRIGIIGASIGANLACVAASSDLFHIKSAVSISAKTSAVQNLSGQEEVITPRNIFYIASIDEQDGLRKKWANELYTMTKGHRKVAIAKGDKHGSFILRESKDLESEILNWFDETL